MVLNGWGEPSRYIPLSTLSSLKGRPAGKAYCAYCQSEEHYFIQFSGVAQLSLEQLKEWIRVNKRY